MAFFGSFLSKIGFASNSQLTSIANYVFYGTNISNINIPDGVDGIGNFAFTFVPITSIKIPRNVGWIGENAFYSCTLLNTIIYDGTMAEWNEIIKYEYWNYDVPATKVICSDGEVSL